eukprot:354575-Chlamydomonas_euryale.AAC.11
MQTGENTRGRKNSDGEHNTVIGGGQQPQDRVPICLSTNFPQSLRWDRRLSCKDVTLTHTQTLWVAPIAAYFFRLAFRLANGEHDFIVAEGPPHGQLGVSIRMAGSASRHPLATSSVGGPHSGSLHASRFGLHAF